ncbi:flavodoxin family protein [Kitasatospora sp. NPDC053057]|uniref:flavodoxin family protein n=1 Tax=Kitasatospora sp. NPDC053057 TaxID=3364062 RepID=UPI0037C66382
MRIVIVYESLFGNTHEIAEAIGDGLREARPDAQIACLRVAEASPDATAAADLLLVGGPTHMRGMSRSVSRKMALKVDMRVDESEAGHEPEEGAEGPGVRDWFHTLPKAVQGARAAAFDTRGDARMSGGAAPAIARRLRHHGYTLAAEPEGFIVEDAEGPLREGERSRARAWGSALV